MTAKLYNIGPSAIAEAGTDGGPAFTLSRPEWIAIQTYCTDANALPTTDDAFRKSLGSGAPSDLSDFTSLIEAYSAIHDHVSTWSDKTYPASVALASDIVTYGLTKAPVYYPPILKEAEILQDNPDDQKAKDALKAILDSLKRDADNKASKAAAVVKDIAQFATDTEADKITLVGTDGNDGLVKYYDDKYGRTSDEVVELTKEIKAQQDVLQSANKEYDHDVVVAATTPTYGWVWPFGTVAASVVAGVYGKRATEALDRGRAAQNKINELSDKLAADANLMVAINHAELGMNKISRDVAAALPVIQKIQGVWGGISDDLASLSKMIDDDIRNVPPIIMDLGVDEAVKAWHNVALNADAYRVNAYVKEQAGPGSMASWLVSTQFASARAAA